MYLTKIRNHRGIQCWHHVKWPLNFHGDIKIEPLLGLRHQFKNIWQRFPIFIFLNHSTLNILNVKLHKSDNVTEQERNIIDCDGTQPGDTVWQGTGEGPLRGARTQDFSGGYGLWIFPPPPPSDQIHQSSCIIPVPSTGVVLPPIVESGQVFHPTIQVILSSEDIGQPGTSSHHDMISQTNTTAVPSYSYKYTESFLYHSTIYI